MDGANLNGFTFLGQGKDTGYSQNTNLGRNAKFSGISLF